MQPILQYYISILFSYNQFSHLHNFTALNFYKVSAGRKIVGIQVPGILPAFTATVFVNITLPAWLMMVMIAKPPCSRMNCRLALLLAGFGETSTPAPEETIIFLVAVPVATLSV